MRTTSPFFYISTINGLVRCRIHERYKIGNRWVVLHKGLCSAWTVADHLTGLKIADGYNKKNAMSEAEKIMKTMLEFDWSVYTKINTQDFIKGYLSFMEIVNRKVSAEAKRGIKYAAENYFKTKQEN